MMQHEKDGLLTLLGSQERWCRDAEARDGHGHAVHFNDPAAVAWDLTGALCLLFGWPRATQLFPQLDRHLNGRLREGEHARHKATVEPQIISMVAIQEYNDLSETTYELMMDRLRTLVVYKPEAHQSHSTASV